jgi:WD40 repeat protein
MAELTPERWARVQDIVERAAKLPTTARDAFLDVACGDDTTVRRQVEAMLAADETTGDFLQKPVTLGDIVDESIHIDRYRILDRIGTGGMGVVYLGERADQSFEQRVAVKVLKRGMDTEDIVRRFHLERQTLANLQHSNIAKLLDGGATTNDRPYLVMELIDGAPIDRYCHDKELDLRQRLELFARVCDAVAHAHRNLVVHRDLKPSNILVDRSGQPKLLDFGVAKLLDHEEGGAALTATGERLMTPRYASPEQVLGGPITTATDVYSLGVVLYEIVAGVSPYQMQTTSRREIERAVLEDKPLAPSEAVSGSTRLRRQLRGDVDTIVLTALRKEPERRYSSAEALASDLRRALRHEPIVARPDTWTYRAQRFVRRNRGTTALASALLIALVTGLVASLLLYREASDAREIAEQSERDARFEALVGNVAAADVELDLHRAHPALARLRRVDERDRDWCWHHLQSRASESVETMKFDGSLTDVVLTDEAATIMVSTADRKILFIDRKTSTLADELTLIDGPRDHPAIAGPDQHGIAAVAFRRGGAVQLVDTVDRAVLLTIETNVERMTDLALSEDGRWLAIVGPDGLRIFEGPSWREVISPRIDMEALDAAFLTAPEMLAVAVEDGTVRLLNLASGRETDVFPLRCHELVTTEDGTIVASDPEGCLHIRKPNGAITRTRIGDTDARSLAIVPWLDAIAVGTVDGAVRLVDLESGHVMRSFAGHLRVPGAFAVDVHQQLLYSVSIDRHLRAWDLSDHGIETALYRSKNGLRRFALDPSVDRAAVIRGDGAVLLLDVDTSETLALIEDANAVDIEYLSNGREFLVASNDGMFRAYDAYTARLLREHRIPVSNGDVGPMAIGERNGRVFAVVTCGNTAYVIDTSSGTIHATCIGHAESIRDVTVDPQSGRIATAARDGEVRVWDADSGKVLHVLLGHESAALAVAFHPVTNELITGAFDRTIRTWDLGSGTESSRIEEYGTVLSLAINPSGDRIVGGATAIDLRVWDASRAQDVLPLNLGSFAYPRAIAFSPNGTEVYATISRPLVDGRSDDYLRRWSTESYSDRFHRRRAILDQRHEAAQLVSRLEQKHASYSSIAFALRADSALDAILRRSALNEVLRRGAKKHMARSNAALSIDD